MGPPGSELKALREAWNGPGIQLSRASSLSLTLVSSTSRSLASRLCDIRFRYRTGPERSNCDTQCLAGSGMDYARQPGVKRMSFLSEDLLTSLAFSVYENKGVFALLLGSGLSRAAGIPTGWEITVDLIRRVATAEGVADQTDWAAWYREQTGSEPDYSSLLERLASSPEERRAILHSYIEPTAEDREESRKLPTRAHVAIAELVRAGYVRVIVTTNFDRLLENALRESGVEPTVIASVDALAGAEPIAHSACYILKLHGDYKDARIRNTESELGGYPAQYDALLDRILDEYGMIVCGWSGEWDYALRAAFLRAANRRYSLFWATRGDLADGAEGIVRHRRGRVISIAEADAFFPALLQRVETLQQTHRQNPLSIELLVNSAKRFLGKPEYRIQLEELFAEETNRVLGKVESPEFGVQGPWDQGAFRSRIERYEAITESLASAAGVLGRWGDDSELPLALEVIRSLYASAEKVGGGLVVYLNNRSYPAVLVFTSYGLGLTRAARWHTLHQLFEALIDISSRNRARTVESLFLWTWKGTEQDAWKQIEGLDRRKTPLSDHLLELFLQWGKRFMGLAADFELMFERFEMLGSLSYFQGNDKAAVHQQLKSGQDNAWPRVPVGRAGWHQQNSVRLIAELQGEPLKSAILKAGFAKGDPELLDLFIETFRRIAGRMSW